MFDKCQRILEPAYRTPTHTMRWLAPTSMVRMYIRVRVKELERLIVIPGCVIAPERIIEVPGGPRRAPRGIPGGPQRAPRRGLTTHGGPMGDGEPPRGVPERSPGGV